MTRAPTAKRFLGVPLALAILAAACGGSDGAAAPEIDLTQPLPTATAGPEPQATAEPEPTATVAPTPTAEPEPTPTAEPEPTAEPDPTPEPDPESTTTVAPPADAERIEGASGTLTPWTHSSERLRARLPAGWLVVERDGGLASFLASPDPTGADAKWEVDAVYVTLYESPTIDDFVADHFDTALANGCEQVDGTPLTETGNGQFVIGRENRCGEATARVAGIYGAEAGLGVIVEGQTDDLPDAAADDELVDDVLRSIEWR